MKGQISIYINEDKTTIQVRDVKSHIVFLEINLTPEQLSMALSRLSDTPCELKVRGLDKVGKNMGYKTLELPVPENASNEEIEHIFDNHLKGSEWISDNYFNAKNSFFYKEKQKYARTTIRRWI